MPIMRCQIKGRKGFKWGQAGKCYIGVTGRAKALAQMRAIKAQQTSDAKEFNKKFFADSFESQTTFRNQLLALKQTGQLKNSPKRLPRWLPQPIANEKKYFKIIKEILNPFKNIVNEKIRPQLKNWVEENQRLNEDGYEFVTDQIEDWNDEFDETLGEYDDLESEIFEDDLIGLETELFFIAGVVNAFNLKQFEKIFKKALGIEYLAPERWYQNLSKSWVKDNVNLIKGLSQEYRKKFTNTIYNGMRQGKTWDAIEKDLIKINKSIYTGRTETRIIKGKKVRVKIQSRSELIARDQVNKLNGRLTKKRQTDLGIDKYMWRTVGDAKVRPTHRPLNGKTMQWEDDTVYSTDGGINWLLRGDIGGYIGIPGEDIQCRCGADPVFDDILAEIEAMEEF